MLWIAFRFVSLHKLRQHSSQEASEVSVVNCFQICIFTQAKTTKGSGSLSTSLLWIAFRFVSLHKLRQQTYSIRLSEQVVNCFQICIFTQAKTTVGINACTIRRLWIAFRFVSLHKLRQLERCGCICTHVVNCFQICIFTQAKTTIAVEFYPLFLLWIAFRFVSLHKLRQPPAKLRDYTLGCELLSDLYLYTS